MAKKRVSTPPSRLSPEAQALANELHSANIIVTNYDYLRAKEASHQDGLIGVSALVRLALSDYLDNHPNAEAITTVTNAYFESQVLLNVLREGFILNPDKAQ